MQLLLSVNGVLFGFVLLFLYLDYRSTLSNRLIEKTESLAEEANTILPGVIHLEHHGKDKIQEYIDDVCERMEEGQSPFHHIGVKINSDFMQSQNHHSQHLKLEDLLKLESQKKIVDFAGKRFALGVQKEKEVAVFVVEEVSHIQTAVQMVVGQHFLAILALSLMAAVIVNILLLRLVNQPIKKLVEQVRKIGSGEFGTESRHSRTHEFDYLFGEVNNMSQVLELSLRQRKASLERARTIQLNLLPKEFAELRGLDVAHYYCPAEEVGGDFFDVRHCGDNKWFFCVADSAGHGVPAAMSAAMVKALLFKPVELLAKPAQLLSEMNRQFMMIHPYGEFATIFLAFADLDKGELVYANAGHGSGWLYSDASPKGRELTSSGTPLGIEGTDPWIEETVCISKSSRLVVSTDGIVESFDENDAMYGTQRLDGQLCRGRKSNPEKLVHDVIRSIEEFRGEGKQLDDITLLVVDFKDSTTPSD